MSRCFFSKTAPTTPGLYIIFHVLAFFSESVVYCCLYVWWVESSVLTINPRSRSESQSLTIHVVRGSNPRWQNPSGPRPLVKAKAPNATSPVPALGTWHLLANLNGLELAPFIGLMINPVRLKDEIYPVRVSPKVYSFGAYVLHV